MGSLVHNSHGSKLNLASIQHCECKQKITNINMQVPTLIELHCTLPYIALLSDSLGHLVTTPELLSLWHLLCHISWET